MTTPTTIPAAPTIDWSRVKAVSWDVDGTLYSTSGMHREVRQRIGHGLLTGGPIEGFRSLRALWRHVRFVRRVRAGGGDLHGDRGPWDHPDHTTMLRRWLLPAIEATGVRPGVVGALDHIAARGIPQVVASDFEGEEKVVVLGLEGHFRHCFAADALGQIKPSPRLFEHICAEMNIAAPELLHIGDRDECDGEAARTAGCQVIISPEGNFVLPD